MTRKMVTVYFFKKKCQINKSSNNKKKADELYTYKINTIKIKFLQKQENKAKKKKYKLIFQAKTTYV